MTRIEVDLLIALCLLYAYECVYWIRSDERAFTRSSMNWKIHDRGPLSFTLLNNAPVLVDPFLLRPGFVRKKNTDGHVTANTERILRKVARRLDELWFLETQCRIQAMLFLLFVPWIIWTHRLAALWHSLGLALLISHTLLMLSYGITLHRHARKRLLSVAAPMIFNPLGATRLFDGLSQVLFDEEIKRCSNGP
jgi:hypothetical protein